MEEDNNKKLIRTIEVIVFIISILVIFIVLREGFSIHLLWGTIAVALLFNLNKFAKWIIAWIIIPVGQFFKYLWSKRKVINALSWILILLLIISNIHWFLYSKKKEISQEAQLRNKSDTLVIQSLAKWHDEGNATDAFILAKKAVDLHDNDFSRKALYQTYFQLADTPRRPFYTDIFPLGSDCTSFDLSPDGNFIVTGHLSSDIQIKDLRKSNFSKAIQTLPHSPSGRIRSVKFSRDGNFIVSSSESSADSENIIKVFIKTDNEWKDYKHNKQSGAILKAEFSPLDNYIVSISTNNNAKIWSTDLNNSITLDNHNGDIVDISFSSDGKKFVTASHDHTAKVWDANGKLLTNLDKHEFHVLKARFSPDDNMIVTASRDKTAIIWTIKDNKIVKLIPLVGHKHSVWSAEFSPDQRYIITASRDGTCKLWDLRGKCLFTIKDHKEFVISARFSKDGKYILTSSKDKTAKVFKLSDNHIPELIASLNGHKGGVEKAQFVKNGKKVITFSDDKTVKIWDINFDLTSVLENTESQFKTILSADISESGTDAVTASGNNAYVWKKETKGRWELITTLKDHKSLVTHVRFSPNENKVITASLDGSAIIWHLNGEIASRLEGVHRGGLTCAEFSPDSTMIVTSSEDSTAIVWSMKENEFISSPALKGHNNWLTYSSFSLDNKLVATASDTSIFVWDINKSKAISFMAGREVGHIGRITNVSFSSDGSKIFSTSYDGNIRAWKFKEKFSSNKVIYLQGYILSSSFSDDRRFVVAAVHNKSPKIVSMSGGIIADLGIYGEEVVSAKFSKNDNYIITTTRNGTSRVWVFNPDIAYTQLIGKKAG